jgi:hypothetical protein
MLLPVVNHAKIEDRQEWGKLVHGAREESRVSDVACHPQVTVAETRESSLQETVSSH